MAELLLLTIVNLGGGGTGVFMQLFEAREKDCLFRVAIRTDACGRPVGLMTVDGGGVSDDVARCLEKIADAMGADFAALPRYVIDIQFYAGRFTVSGLSDQARVFARHGVTDLRFCYLMAPRSFEQIRALLVELFARQGVTLTPVCRPTMAEALSWLESA